MRFKSNITLIHSKILICQYTKQLKDDKLPKNLKQTYPLYCQLVIPVADIYYED